MKCFYCKLIALSQLKDSIFDEISTWFLMTATESSVDAKNDDLKINADARIRGSGIRYFS
ncbi:hypothetical protein D1AOALGA4SA_5991 [Olavius algarvensis Delta 1 endosymbiont]|nr:hypothetical protein D1AOALGA4SA_5991 [Olavius algarvensis Delta 1 endosymbiont]